MLALVNAKLIDGTGAEPISNATILINGTRFQHVGSHITIPADAYIIDLDNCTVLPGLIDCHVHLGGLTVDKPGKALGKVSFKDLAFFFIDYFRDYSHRRGIAIENGVTTIKSAGDLFPHIIKLRDKISAGRLSGPRIFAPGPTFTAPGGHPAGTIYKGNRYIIESAVRQIGDAKMAKEEANKLIEGGVDCIKAIYSDIDPMNTGRKVPMLSLAVLEALDSEAHRHNLRLMVHTGSPRESLEAIKVGADSIEHGLLPGSDSMVFSDELVDLMIARGTYFVPTIAAAWAYKELYPELFSGLKKIVKILFDAGVNIAAGTDSGMPGVVIGSGLHKELSLLVEAGLSPMQAIIAGTQKAADNLGTASELGTIEYGKLADAVVVSGDPLEDIRNTKNIKMVIKNGVIVKNTLN